MKKKDDEPTLFDLSEGRRLRDEGMIRAASHANRITDDWQDKAYQILCEFVAKSDGQSFLAEDVRAYAINRHNLPHPPDNRAWGAPITKAAKAGLIVRIGYRQSRQKDCHASPNTVWRAT